ncbi:MAG: hypothetical protein C0600_07495 [Ignavibacteria bacterium]|nr:MAG: hypothetical protein C0600_07495 [Ignavibacteria bacterium]
MKLSLKKTAILIGFLLVSALEISAQDIHIKPATSVNLGSSSLTIVGDLTTQGMLVPGSASTLVFEGISDQHLSGVVSARHVLLRGGGTLLLDSGLQILGILTLDQGYIMLGDQDLFIGTEAAIQGTPSDAAMLVTDGTGTVRKSFATTGSFTFPVGDLIGGADYSPVTLDLVSGSLHNAEIGVIVVPQKHPLNEAINDYITRYWRIVPSGLTNFSITGTFQYAAGDVVGSDSHLWLGKREATHWSLYHEGDPATRALTGTYSDGGIFSGLPAPELDAPTLASFGKVVNGEWKEMTITVENIGDINLAVASSTLIGTNATEYSIESGAAPFILAPGQSRDLTIRLQPNSSTTIAKTAVLKLTSNDPYGPEQIALTGFGIPALEQPYTLLAGDDIQVDGQKESDGDFHANGSIVFARGSPSTHNGNCFAGSQIRVAQNNTIDGDIQGAQLLIHPNAVVTGTQTSSAASAVSLPTYSFMPGATDVTVPQDGDVTIAPGAYGSVTVNKNGTLRVSTGSYAVEKLVLKNNAALAVDMTHGPASVDVKKNLQCNTGSSVTYSPWTDASRWLFLHAQQTTDVILGTDSRILAQLSAPAADVYLEDGAGYRGSITGASIEIGSDVTLYHHNSPSSLPREGERLAFVRPAAVQLHQNFPNPFSSVTTISFALSERAPVRLRVFDSFGRLITTLAEDTYDAGTYYQRFNAGRLSSGIYMVELETEVGTMSRIMQVVR